MESGFHLGDVSVASAGGGAVVVAFRAQVGVCVLRRGAAGESQGGCSGQPYSDTRIYLNI